jgi:hypothetical protein
MTALDSRSHSEVGRLRRSRSRADRSALYVNSCYLSHSDLSLLVVGLLTVLEAVTRPLVSFIFERVCVKAPLLPIPILCNVVCVCVVCHRGAPVLCVCVRARSPPELQSGSDAFCPGCRFVDALWADRSSASETGKASRATLCISLPRCPLYSTMRCAPRAPAGERCPACRRSVNAARVGSSPLSVRASLAHRSTRAPFGARRTQLSRAEL